MPARIYYDGECPFCTRYVGLIHLRDTVGRVDLIDLRSDADLRARLTGEGFDLDQGMVVDLDGKRVGGADATHLLACLSTSSGLFNRLNRAVFGVSFLSAFIYPFLRSGRWFTLFLMGRATINDTDQTAVKRQTLFAMLFALFSLFHVYNYLFEYARWPITIDLAAIFGAALLLLLRPGSPRLLFLLMLFSTISTILQAPITSNHTMVRTMLLIGYWLSLFYAIARAMPVGAIFGNAVLAGRGTLLVMYFYGIFHKINTGFLDPETSCAAALWDQMLPPMVWMQSVYVDYLAIYGTFIVEGLLVVALLIPRTRHIGMIGGIAFHMFLATSNFAAYISFTTLTISLHVLWLNSAQLDRINQSDDMAWLRAKTREPLYVIVFFSLLIAGAAFMFIDRYNLGALCLLPLVIVVCTLILKYGRNDPDTTPKHSRGAYSIGAFVTLLFFINSAMPYMGLKTSQTVNMFSNLRIEAGISNHVVFPEPPGMFAYLDDTAVLTAQGNSSGLTQIDDPQFGFVYYALLSALADNPDLRISYIRNGERFENIGAVDVQDDIDSILHPAFMRKFFHFRKFALEEPTGCF